MGEGSEKVDSCFWKMYSGGRVCQIVFNVGVWHMFWYLFQSKFIFAGNYKLKIKN